MQSFRIEDDSIVEAWRRLTHSMAISILLRGTPYHFQHEKSYFPADLAKKYDLPSFRECDIKSDKVQQVIKEMAEYALDNYNSVRKLWKQGCKGPNKQFETMILLGSPSIFYLEQLKKRNYKLTGRNRKGLERVDESLSSPFMNVKLQNRLLRQKSFKSY